MAATSRYRTSYVALCTSLTTLQVVPKRTNLPGLTRGGGRGGRGGSRGGRGGWGGRGGYGASPPRGGYV